LSSATCLFEGIKQRFLCFDRTAWYKEGHPKDIAPFLSTVALEHKVLPQLSRLDKKKMRRKLRRLIKDQVKPLPIVDTKVDHDPVFPVRRQLLARTVIPMDRPESSTSNPRKRSPQPLCHTTKPSLRKLYKEWYREFCVAYENSSREYRVGNTEAEFPPGSFAPSKYPRARYASDPDAKAKLHPTRRNLDMADALMTLAA
jgi:hypothetical protein